MKTNKNRLLSLFAGIFIISSSAMAVPMTTFQGTANGVFSNPSGGVTTGVGTNFFTWGVGSPDVSSLRFTGKNFSVTTPTGYILGSSAQSNRPVFSLGTLDYHNGTIQGGTGATSVRLDTTVQLSAPVQAGPTAIPAQLNLINSPNTNDPVASADSVFLPGSLTPVTLTTAGGAPITVEPSGFGNATSGGFTQVSQFFVFEGASASADLFAQIASPCEPIVRNAVTTSVANVTGMQASFTPNFNLSISDAASLCGYDHFNWYQVVTNDPYPPDAKSNPGVPLIVPYVDPPIGGYSYQTGNDSLPFYWAEGGLAPQSLQLSTYTTSTSLSFIDYPAESRLQPGEFIGFTTTLAGVLPDNSWDALFSWNWITDFNGTVGGVSIRDNPIPPDLGSGTGGVTILDTDLSAGDIPQNVRDLMERDGARNVEPYSVPEPSSFVLLLCGLLILAVAKIYFRVETNTDFKSCA